MAGKGSRPRRVPINRIDFEASPLPRAEINSDAVTEYAELLRAGETLPAVILYTNGARFWIGDGWHRIKAEIRASGHKTDHLPDDVTISAHVEKGTLRDCILHAVGANSKHGVRRTSEDKRKAVGLLLSDSDWGKRSDSWVAEKCRVSDKTVARVRAEIQPSSEIRSCRKGKDGRTRNVTRIGKARKPALPNPKATKKTEGDSREEERENVVRPIEPVVNKLPGGPEEPAKATVTDDRASAWVIPCPDPGDPWEMPCEHVEGLLRDGLAHMIKGRPVLRVHNNKGGHFERDMHYCPMCGVAVTQTEEAEQTERTHGDMGATASAPAGA